MSCGKDGRGAAGRQHLVSVLANGDGTFHLHAAVMIALSYVMDQQHTCALEYCRRAGEIHRSQSRPSQNLTKLAQVLKVSVFLACYRVLIQPLEPHSPPVCVVSAWSLVSVAV